jgi:CBS domain-containing protein
MTLAKFCREVVVVTEADTSAVAACRMRDAHVGCLVVVRGTRPIGIVTDRDIAIRVVAEGRAPELTRVADIATYGPAVIREDACTQTATRRMREHGIRRLPIVDPQGNLTGIVTADDLIALFSGQIGDLGEMTTANTDSNESK